MHRLKLDIGVKVEPSDEFHFEKILERAEMKIGELAELTDSTPRQLRYYEQKGLIGSERSSNGYRTYSDDTVEQVRQIRALLDSGFNTELIAQLLPCVQGPEAELPPNHNPEMEQELRTQMKRMEEQIEMLTHSHHRFECYLKRVEAESETGKSA